MFRIPFGMLPFLLVCISWYSLLPQTWLQFRGTESITNEHKRGIVCEILKAYFPLFSTFHTKIETSNINEYQLNPRSGFLLENLIIS
jgi:hypothetical protein